MVSSLLRMYGGGVENYELLDYLALVVALGGASKKGVENVEKPPRVFLGGRSTAKSPSRETAKCIVEILTFIGKFRFLF